MAPHIFCGAIFTFPHHYSLLYLRQSSSIVSLALKNIKKLFEFS